MNRFVIAKAIIVVFIIVLFRPLPLFAQEKSKTLIIHQIRGSESCCHGGVPDMISEINANSEKAALPLAWALRFDALTDETFIKTIKSLPKIQELGMLLEMTPRLASESGVVYKGDLSGSDWYTPRNAFLIGYTQDERKKLIDTVFGSFKETFGYHPSFTVSWMIDAWSLGYLKTMYDVELHEITKEQYETDSYTLYGGIFNAAYYPSFSHPLIPALTSSNRLDLVMVRQTVSDIDKNYGSGVTYFTSQPNDYLSNPQSGGTEYFNQLLSQMENQAGLVVLGLENSDEWNKFKDEYQKQLDIVVQMQKDGKINVVSPHEYSVEFKNQSVKNQPHILKSPAFPQEEGSVLWYFGTTYRARLQVIGDSLRLTDLRNYSEQSDPYKTKKAETSRAYWILPYTFDGSQQYTLNSTSLVSKIDPYAGHPVRSDSGVEPFGITLSNSKLVEVVQTDESVVLKGTTSEITFFPEYIQTTEKDGGFALPINQTFENILSENTNQFVSFPKHPRFFITPKQSESTLVIGWETPKLSPVPMTEISKEGEAWRIKPLSVADTDIDDLAVIFQPDRAVLPFDPNTSVFYWHNKTAIAGRNPIRLYIAPFSSMLRPVRIESLKVHLDDASGITAQVPAQLETKLEPFFIDFVAPRSGASTVSFTIGSTIIPSDVTLRFVTDCQKELMKCFTNREDLKQFIQIFVQEKIEFYTKQLQQLAEKAKWEMEKKLKLF